MDSNARLTKYFIDNKIKHKEISEKTGYSPSQISKYLSGTSLITQNFISALVKGFPQLDLNLIFKEDINEDNFIIANNTDDIKMKSIYEKCVIIEKLLYKFHISNFTQNPENKFELDLQSEIKPLELELKQAKEEIKNLNKIITYLQKNESIYNTEICEKIDFIFTEMKKPIVKAKLKTLKDLIDQKKKEESEKSNTLKQK